jgi:hypothetical protein
LAEAGKKDRPFALGRGSDGGAPNVVDSATREQDNDPVFKATASNLVVVQKWMIWFKVSEFSGGLE